MKLKFHWAQWGGELCPLVTVIGAKQDFAEPLSCLLVDDGGLSKSSWVEFLEAGIVTTSYVMKGGESEHWNCSAWGATIDIYNVEVCSLYDDNYYKTIVRTEDFLRILTSWLEFVSSEPSEENFVVESIDVK